MDQEVLVAEQIDGGRLMINELPAHGFPVTAAAWANLADDGRYYLYIASPYVDAHGWNAAYGVVDQAEIAIRQRGHALDALDIFSVKVVESTHHLAQFISQVLRSRANGGGSGIRGVQFPVCRPGDHTASGVYMYGVQNPAPPAPQPA